MTEGVANCFVFFSSSRLSWFLYFPVDGARNQLSSGVATKFPWERQISFKDLFYPNHISCFFSLVSEDRLLHCLFFSLYPILYPLCSFLIFCFPSHGHRLIFLQSRRSAMVEHCIEGGTPLPSIPDFRNNGWKVEQWDDSNSLKLGNI